MKTRAMIATTIPTAAKVPATAPLLEKNELLVLSLEEVPTEGLVETGAEGVITTVVV